MRTAIPYTVVRRSLAHHTRCLTNRIPTHITHDSKDTNSFIRRLRLRLTATRPRGCPSLTRRVIKGGV
jgi:hypothetical protein